MHVRQIDRADGGCLGRQSQARSILCDCFDFAPFCPVESHQVSMPIGEVQDTACLRVISLAARRGLVWGNLAAILVFKTSANGGINLSGSVAKSGPTRAICGASIKIVTKHAFCESDARDSAFAANHPSLWSIQRRIGIMKGCETFGAMMDTLQQCS